MTASSPDPKYPGASPPTNASSPVVGSIRQSWSALPWRTANQSAASSQVRAFSAASTLSISCPTLEWQLEESRQRHEIESAALEDAYENILRQQFVSGLHRIQRAESERLQRDNESILNFAVHEVASNDANLGLVISSRLRSSMLDVSEAESDFRQQLKEDESDSFCGTVARFYSALDGIRQEESRKKEHRRGDGDIALLKRALRNTMAVVSDQLEETRLLLSKTLASHEKDSRRHLDTLLELAIVEQQLASHTFAKMLGRTEAAASEALGILKEQEHEARSRIQHHFVAEWMNGEAERDRRRQNALADERSKALVAQKAEIEELRHEKQSLENKLLETKRITSTLCDELSVLVEEQCKEEERKVEEMQRAIEEQRGEVERTFRVNSIVEANSAFCGTVLESHQVLEATLLHEHSELCSMLHSMALSYPARSRVRSQESDQSDEDDALGMEVLDEEERQRLINDFFGSNDSFGVTSTVAAGERTTVTTPAPRPVDKRPMVDIDEYLDQL